MKPSRLRHLGVVVTTFVIFAALVAASAWAWRINVALWFAFQLGVALSILRSFCLLHDLGHTQLFKTRWASDVWGLLASIPNLVPYYSWKRIHTTHHVWAGWKDLDPSEDDSDFSALKPWEKFLARTSWKLWLPLISLSYSIRNFWNLRKLARLFPSREACHVPNSDVLPAHVCRRGCLRQ